MFCIGCAAAVVLGCPVCEYQHVLSAFAVLLYVLGDHGCFFKLLESFSSVFEGFTIVQGDLQVIAFLFTDTADLGASAGDGYEVVFCACEAAPSAFVCAVALGLFVVFLFYYLSADPAGAFADGI